MNYSTVALEVLLINLQDRWQKVKINTAFSSSTQLLQQGVSQRSVLEPILFNIYINVFCLKEIDVCNFAYDVTPEVCDSNLKSDVGAQFWATYYLVWNELRKT